MTRPLVREKAAAEKPAAFFASWRAANAVYAAGLRHVLAAC
jgi:hypothetical protein